MKTPGGGGWKSVWVCVCMWVAEAASWHVCKAGGGGAKQEDEVIVKVQGGEAGGERLRVEPGRVTFVPEMSSAAEA